MALFGMDVSIYQKNLNYFAIKAAGVHFAMVKASQGHSTIGSAYLFKDKMFETHINGFTKVGIPVGAYHFLTASNLTETYREADFFLETVAPFRDKIELFLACDAENYNNKYLKGLSRAQLTAIINAFCGRVEAAGLKACHYTNTDHIAHFINLDKIAYPVWQAHYMNNGVVCRPNDAGNRLAIHQYRNDGLLPGVVGVFDLNFGYAPLARLIVGARASLMDVTLDYIEKYPTGNEILLQLAKALCERKLNPTRNLSHEHLVSFVQGNTALTTDQAAYLNAYRWSEDLFRKLYLGMIAVKKV